MINALSRNGNVIMLNNGEALEKLPVGIYMLRKATPFLPYRLEYVADSFELPKKIYGNPKDLVSRYIKRWKNRNENNMGIVFQGDKGSGKTLCAKYMCNLLKAPIIMITEGCDDEAFLAFISHPAFHDSVILIDEFEKLYDQSQKNDSGLPSVNPLLSLMDGVHQSRFLFMLTCNGEINEFLVNRPGRVRYQRSFNAVTQEEADEIIEDLLENKEHAEELYDVIDEIGNMNVDTLLKLVDDVNLFNQPPSECVKFFNIKMSARSYDLDLVVGDSLMSISAGFLYDVVIPTGRSMNKIAIPIELTPSAHDAIVDILIDQINDPRVKRESVRKRIGNNLYYIGDANNMKKGEDGRFCLSIQGFFDPNDLSELCDERHEELPYVSAKIFFKPLRKYTSTASQTTTMAF